MDLGYAAVDPEMRRLTEAAVRTFATLGCAVDEASPGFPDPLQLFADVTAPTAPPRWLRTSRSGAIRGTRCCSSASTTAGG